MWWPFRTRLGTPSRSDPPETFRLRKMRVTNKNADGTISYEKMGVDELPSNEYPLSYVAYKFPPPAILVDRDPEADVNYEIFGKISKDEFRKHTPNNKDGFWVAPSNPNAFLRLLAKIAHAYATAELGQGIMRPILTDFIRGHSLRALEWIGADQIGPISSDVLHEIGWEIVTVKNVNYVVVDLRLFSFLGTPKYQIVVGELIDPIKAALSNKRTPYKIEVKAFFLGELSPFVGESIRVSGGSLN